MTVKVLRPFDGYRAGDILDASAWTWTDLLIQQQYVQPVYEIVEKPSGKRRPEA